MDYGHNVNCYFHFHAVFGGGKCQIKGWCPAYEFTSSLGNNGSAAHRDKLFEEQCPNSITHNTCDGSGLLSDGYMKGRSSVLMCPTLGICYSRRPHPSLHGYLDICTDILFYSYVTEKENSWIIVPKLPFYCHSLYINGYISFSDGHFKIYWIKYSGACVLNDCSCRWGSFWFLWKAFHLFIKMKEIFT